MMKLFLNQSQIIMMKEFDTSKILGIADTEPPIDHLQLLKSIPDHSSNLFKKLIYLQTIDWFIKKNFDKDITEVDQKLLKHIMNETT